MKIQALALVLFGTLLASSPAQGAAIPSWTVGNVKIKTQDGLKVKQIKVRLRFEHDRLEIYSAREGRATLLKQLPYADIAAANYAAFGGGVPGLGFLTSGRKHWLAIRCGSETALLMLDKNNHEAIREQLSTRTGVTVKHSTALSNRSFHVPASL